jgi:hypothetical protein
MINQLLTILNQARLFHWQTPRYLEHVGVFGQLYDALDELVDDMIEAQAGYAGSVEAPDGGFTLRIFNYASQSDASAFLGFTTDYLVNALPKELKPEQTDILAIRDDMLAAVNRAKYLMRQT